MPKRKGNPPMLDTIEVQNPHGLIVPDIRVVRGELRYDQERVTVARSIRGDPLGEMHAKRQISDAQYAAGRRYQATSEAMGIGVSRSPGDIKEPVDGGLGPTDGLTDRKLDAAKQMDAWRQLLGARGFELVQLVLIAGRSHPWIARQLYGGATQANRRYVGRLFRDCLDQLAADMGLG